MKSCNNTLFLLLFLVQWSKSSSFSLPIPLSRDALCYTQRKSSKNNDMRSLNSMPTKNYHLTSLKSMFNPPCDGGIMYSSLKISQTTLQTLLSTSSTVPLSLSFFFNSIAFLFLKKKLLKVLTPLGFYHSLALGTLLWNTLGWKGWTTCVLYLALGSAVTKVKFAEKEKMGIAQGRGGRRGPENVWGSAATGLLCAISSTRVSSTGFRGISSSLFVLGYVSSLATKLADTFASEIGTAYGKTTFLITTFERVKPGTEGAISLEGTLAALFGGSLLPLYALCIGLLPNFTSVGIATVAAFLATNAESLIGATLQGKKGFNWMTNEVVNFINTVIGAGIGIFSGMLLL